MIYISGYNISKIGEHDYISKVMSQAAIEAVKEHPSERMFNDYNLGEALIYHDIPVFFDAILIMKDRPLYTYISSHEEMVECIYEDDSLAYFKIIE